MKLWFDEDLSPTLVAVANRHGLQGTSNRDRDMLGVSDAELRSRVEAEDYVLVTDNASDFRPMYAREEIHPGLIVMPGTVRRERQQQLAAQLIDWIADTAAAVGETPADFMVNRLVTVDETGACAAHELPEG